MIYRQAISAAGGVPYRRENRPDGPVFSFLGDNFEEVTGFPLETMTPLIWQAAIRETHFRGQLAGLTVEEASRRVVHNEVSTWTADVRIITPDGEERWISDNSIEQRDANGDSTGSVGFLQDVTWRKRLEAEARTALAAAELANRAKSDFLANMSHEIRTPLSAMVGMTRLLLDTELNAEQRDFVQTILSGSSTLVSIVNDVLDFSKVESGMLELEVQPFDLHLCMKGVHDLFRRAAAEKQLLFHLRLAPDLPRQLLGDELRLRQILLNLVGNAVKFTERGAIHVSASVGQRDQTGLVELKFAISDTGIGIPADRTDRLFHSFSQVDASRSRRYGGSGLGLVISKRLCELMGGRIWVESESGVGSHFHVSVWMHSLDEQPVAHSTPESAAEATLDPNLRILLAEDNPTNQKVMLLILNRMGLCADVAANGNDVLKRLEAQVYDVILMDVQMPEMDGLTAARLIRSNRLLSAQPAIVALTANAVSGDREMCLAAGMDAYLGKPFKIEDLTAVLNQVACAK